MSLYINGFSNPYQANPFRAQSYQDRMTTMALGEEGGGYMPPTTTLAYGEDGCGGGFLPPSPSANAINTRDAFNLCGQADRACSPWGGDGRVTRDELSQLGQNLGRMKQLVDMLKGWAPQG
ncbi:MAG: hypothetical protein K2X01_06060 [Cyanobacteria bacterium]|nr:hypothetical protein [Cyanobacteriota bacterium]